MEAIPTADGVRLDFTIPQGEPGTDPEDVFASFYTFMNQFADGSQVPWFTVTPDPTGQIVLDEPARITLAPGYYLVSFHLSAILDNPGYIQITPSYNGAAYLFYGFYFRTGVAKSTANGSSSLIFEVPSQTNFTLTFNSDTTSTEGAGTLTFVKLRRSPYA